MGREADRADGDVAIVRRMWEAFGDGGLEPMLAFADPDAVWVPRSEPGRPLHGPDELRAYFDAMRRRGAVLEARPYEFRRAPDGRVIVRGHVRVRERNGGIADDQVTWAYTVRDGRVVRAEPLA